jgi:hypothetical protein
MPDKLTPRCWKQKNVRIDRCCSRRRLSQLVNRMCFIRVIRYSILAGQLARSAKYHENNGKRNTIMKFIFLTSITSSHFIVDANISSSVFTLAFAGLERDRNSSHFFVTSDGNNNTPTIPNTSIDRRCYARGARDELSGQREKTTGDFLCLSRCASSHEYILIDADWPKCFHSFYTLMNTLTHCQRDRQHRVIFHNDAQNKKYRTTQVRLMNVAECIFKACAANVRARENYAQIELDILIGEYHVGDETLPSTISSRDGK